MRDRHRKKGGHEVESVDHDDSGNHHLLYMDTDTTLDAAGGLPRPTSFSALKQSNPLVKSTSEDDFSSRYRCASTAYSSGYYSDRMSCATTNTSADNSPFNLSPWNNQPSTNPFLSSPPPPATTDLFPSDTGLIGSLVREQGHIYSLAVAGGLLYTGSDSKNIRIWKNQQEFSSFKSVSGLVKAIIISGEGRVFTGHQDGKVRIWKSSKKDSRIHKRIGTLPRLKDFIKSSFHPDNYVEARRRNKRSAVWIRHTDAVSCLCLSEDQSLLYSGSWDRTMKVWRLEDMRCIESVNAHDDTVNAVAAAFGGLVFTGSADGKVKVWRREELPKPTMDDDAKGLVRHVAVSTLVRLEVAVTALAINAATGLVYSGSSDGLVSWWERGEINRMAGGGGRGGGDRGESSVLRGHNVAVLCLVAAGSLLFSGSADATICVWQREAGAEEGHVCMSVLTGHSGPVKCLAVEASGGEGRWVVYSGSLDKSVKMWRVAEPRQRDPLFDIF